MKSADNSFDKHRIRATASSVISAVARMLALAHAAISLTPKWQHFALPFGSLLLCR
jgi:hypothetical protein